MAEPRIVDAFDPDASLCWDTVWGIDPALGNFGSGEWELADVSEGNANQGGLRADDPLTTAVLLCLFTDRRRPDDGDSPDGSYDRRGWHGDTFDIDRAAGERELGSLLWTLERSSLSYDTERLAEHFASEALQTIVDQGAAGAVSVTASARPALGRLEIHVEVFDIAGAPLFARAFPLF